MQPRRMDALHCGWHAWQAPVTHGCRKSCALTGLRLCRDEYLGLRVRLKADPAQAVNIPVNSTVGPSGAATHA